MSSRLRTFHRNAWYIFAAPLYQYALTSLDLVHIARELDRLPQSLAIAGSCNCRTSIASQYMDLHAQAKEDNQSGNELATAIAISYQEIQNAGP
jgi:hypothetical protein